MYDSVDIRTPVCAIPSLLCVPVYTIPMLYFFKDDEHAWKELERLEQEYERPQQMPIAGNSKLVFSGDL